ncbi:MULTISPECIES: hypothetical protein [unclassified Helicobacter]|uniref:hypothetical protein n=1 Tax=unclassified Helicobacter TaxID=2593540 RepID=UPI000B0E348E|nr:MULTISPECIES: hypothetical protein [unclassified Helicobacter]
MEICYECTLCGEENITIFDDDVCTPSEITITCTCIHCLHEQEIHISISQSEV